MNQKERKILQLEENFENIIKEKLLEEQTETKKILIKDIKLVGNIEKDEASKETAPQYLFIVEKYIVEMDENGKKISDYTQRSYYLEDECVAADGNGQIIYSKDFEESKPDKAKAVRDLIDRTPEEEIMKNSMRNLYKKESIEILSAYLGRKVSEDELEELLEKMDDSEIEKLKNGEDKETVEEQKEKKKEKDENVLNKKQAEKIRVNGVQKVNLSQLVDGHETLGKRLDIEQYDYLYVVYSEDVDEISKNSKKNSTRYSLVGMTKEGEAKVLNDEFEMDKSVGSSGSRTQTKIRADGTATRDNKDVSVYTRKSNGMSIGCENEKGSVNVSLYKKTKEENENFGIQLETSRTRRIPLEKREILSKCKGNWQVDNSQNEIEEHNNKGCNSGDIKDIDGKEETKSHGHVLEDMIEEYVNEIYDFEDKDGEKRIKEIFSKKEVQDRLLKKIRETKEKTTIEKIVEEVKKEMNGDAGRFERGQI